MATSSLIADVTDNRPSNQEATVDLAGEGRTAASSGLKLFLWALAAASVLGFIGIAFRFINDGGRQEWGYYAATLAFMMTVFGGAPIVAIAPAIAKAHWARPAARTGHLESACHPARARCSEEFPLPILAGTPRSRSDAKTPHDADVAVLSSFPIFSCPVCVAAYGCVFSSLGLVAGSTWNLILKRPRR